MFLETHEVKRLNKDGECITVSRLSILDVILTFLSFSANIIPFFAADNLQHLQGYKHVSLQIYGKMMI